MTTFRDLGLSDTILKSVSTMGFETPTPIQEQAIPLVLKGHDLMGLAQTGTGKTAAFGLPLVQQLLTVGTKPPSKTVRSLILAPTRELVNQIAVNLRSYVKGSHLRVRSVVGGVSIGAQIKQLNNGTDILVATPGRLLDLVERKALFLDQAKFLVLDEADQMLDLGFIHALKKIAKLVGTPRQTLLFSATMPKQIADLSKAYLNDPVRVETTPPGKAADKVKQSVHFVSQGDKATLLKQYLGERPEDLSLVFARTKHGAEKLMKVLVAAGFKAGSVHGNKSQGQRERVIKAFRAGDVRILVATDVAARGIDIPGVSHVYNYDLPEVPENYVHRIGRTARAGREGQAIAFCSPTENKLLRQIQKLMGTGIDIGGGQQQTDQDAPARGQRGKRGNAGVSHKRTGAPSEKRFGKKRKKSNKPFRKPEGEFASAPTDASNQNSQPGAKPKHNSAGAPKKWKSKKSRNGGNAGEQRSAKPGGTPNNRSGKRRGKKRTPAAA